MRALKDKKKRVEDQLKALNIDIMQMENVTLPKLMEDNDIENYKVAGVGTIYLSTEVYANVLKEDRPKLYAWMRQKGHGDMVVDWVFPQSLTAFAKGQLTDQAENGLNEGNELPAFVKTTLIPTANLRRSK